MKRKLLEKHNRILSFLLALTGIGAACTFGGCEYGVGPVEYGTPSATFKVNGKVTSESGAKIQGIRVIMQTDTSFTNPEGIFQVETVDFPGDKNFNVKFDDTDGELNGAFQSLDTIVSFVNPEFKDGDGHWYLGETSKEFDVKLKPKN